MKPLDTDFTSRPFVSIFEPSCCPMKVTGWYRARHSSECRKYNWRLLLAREWFQIVSPFVKDTVWYIETTGLSDSNDTRRNCFYIRAGILYETCFHKILWKKTGLVFLNPSFFDIFSNQIRDTFKHTITKFWLGLTCRNFDKD